MRRPTSRSPPAGTACQGSAADHARAARAREGRAARRAEDPTENVLRDGLRLERVPDPSILTLFGATGDLAHRKVIPAMYHLWRTNLLPHEFVLLALGRRPYDDESFRAEVHKTLEQFSRVLPLDEDAWRSFSRRIRYQRLDFDDRRGSTRWRHDSTNWTRPRARAATGCTTSRRSRRSSPRSSGSSGGSGSTTNDTTAAGGGSSSRSRSATTSTRRRLNREVGKVFRESQVYRIDHYLGKETVRNLLVFRFGNGIFEPLWNRRYVDHVQITVAESIGIENRGAFYEETGAVRDVLQNHLLQLVSLVAMEPPATFEADALRDEKVKVLRAIGTHPAHPFDDVVRGQYGPGWVSGEQVTATARKRRSTRGRRPRRSSRPGS